MRCTTAGLALLALLGAFPLVACNAKPAPDVTTAAADASAPAKPRPPSNPASPPPARPLLAYAYRYEIQAPTDSVSAMARRQEQACAAAGPETCQVLGSDLGTHDGEVSGSLTLRATPVWIATFRDGLDTQVRAVGGKVTDQSVATDDLARQIVDTGAQLRAKILLRDRLETLLARRAKLEELVNLETNISDVQGEIDTIQSELGAMQGRVQMAELTLSYRSEGAPLGPKVTGPLGRAFGGFLGHAIAVLSWLVTLASYLLPLALVAGLGWLAVGWARARIGRRLPQPPKA